MHLPHDIHERLERRWLARYLQDQKIRHQRQVLNEAEVTKQKAEPASSGSVASSDEQWCG